MMFQSLFRGCVKMLLDSLEIYVAEQITGVPVPQILGLLWWLCAADSPVRWPRSGPGHWRQFGRGRFPVSSDTAADCANQTVGTLGIRCLVVGCRAERSGEDCRRNHATSRGKLVQRKCKSEQKDDIQVCLCQPRMMMNALGRTPGP